MAARLCFSIRWVALTTPCGRRGAGIVRGVSSAIWLQRAGAQVTIIDPVQDRHRHVAMGSGRAGPLCAVAPVTAPGLIAKAPRDAANPDVPLYLRRCPICRACCRGWANICVWRTTGQPAGSRRVLRLSGDSVDSTKADRRSGPV